MASANPIQLDSETLEECSVNDYCPQLDEELTEVVGVMSISPRPPALPSQTITESSYDSQTVSGEPRLPSFYNFQGNTGLQPSRHRVDMAVIKCLDSFFDDTTIETQENERLKTYLRIRPEVGVSLVPEGNKPRSKANKERKVLEIKDDTTVVINPEQKTVNSFDIRSRMHGLRNKQTEFKFTKVLGQSCGQTEVFEECVNPLIEKFMRNENCLIFSYGATNSGKTYTLQGHGTDYGIIPRTLDALFSRIQDRLFKQGDIKPHLYQSFLHLSTREVESLQEKKERVLHEAANIRNELKILKENISFAGSQSSSQGSTVDLVGVNAYSEMNYALFANTTMFSVWVSFAELYNEKVYDLLEVVKLGKNKRRKDLKLLQDKDGFVYIPGLTELHVTSDDEAYKIFLAGRKNLQFAATQLNQKSSRSHSFFTIRVVSVGIGEGLMPYPKTVHRMTFCDLAGMERASQTENEGTRLKESSIINTSLTVLLKVIRLLREKQTEGHGTIETIPFRESKLTHIFKSYLTSSTHICMIVNVNPDPKMADSTIRVLQNSAIASNVIVFRPPEPPKSKEVGKKRVVKPDDSDKENKNPPKILKPMNKRKHPFDSTASSLSDTEDNNQNRVGQDEIFSESDSETQGQTVIASYKLVQQRVQFLENENRELKIKLANSELEKQRIRDQCVKMLAEENRLWSDRFAKLRHAENVMSARKLSLMTPGSKCGRNHTPPRVYMDNIVEDGDDENSSVNDDE